MNTEFDIVAKTAAGQSSTTIETLQQAAINSLFAYQDMIRGAADLDTRMAPHQQMLRAAHVLREAME